MADIKELAQQLNSFMKSEASASWPGITLLEVIDGSGQWTDGYVWCSLAGQTVRCQVPSNIDLSTGSHTLCAVPYGNGSTEFIAIGTSWNGADNSRIPRTRTKEIQSGSDLPITCGAGYTLYLTTPVYNDTNVGALILITGGTLPGIVEWLDNDGDATGIYTRGFAINEQGSGVIQFPYDYKEGTNITFHLHWGGNDAPSGTDYVKWELTYSVTRTETTFPDVTVSTVETAYDTQYELKKSDFTAIDGTNFKIGDHIHFTIKRIAAVGDAYAGEALVESIGFIYQVDTMGSRSETSK